MSLHVVVFAQIDNVAFYLPVYQFTLQPTVQIRIHMWSVFRLWTRWLVRSLHAIIIHEFSLDIDLHIFKNISPSQRLSKILHHWKSRLS